MSVHFDPTSLVAGDVPLVHRTITLASGQNLKRGAVIGRVTSGGKYKLSLTAASDGSQTPDAILATDVDASAGDVTCAAYFSGEFADEIITAASGYGASHTADTVNEAFRAAGREIYIRKLGVLNA